MREDQYLLQENNVEEAVQILNITIGSLKEEYYK